MSHNWYKLAIISAVGAVTSLAVWIGSSTAKEESSVLVKKPAASASNTTAGPILPPPVNPDERPANNSQTRSSEDFFAPSTIAPPANATKQALPTPPQSSASTVKRPFMRPAQPREPATGKLVVGEESMPAPSGVTQDGPVPTVSGVVQEGVRVRPAPPIEYDTDHDARKMYRTGKVNLVMVTTDPADGCAYEIPLCIPACCVGEPRVSGKQGILGRGVVEYRWACGFRAIVKFRHVLGNVKVEYEGD